MKTRLKYTIRPLAEFPNVAVLHVLEMDEQMRGKLDLCRDGFWVCSVKWPKLRETTVHLRGSERKYDNRPDFLAFDTPEECQAYCAKANAAIVAAAEAFPFKDERKDSEPSVDGIVEVKA